MLALAGVTTTEANKANCSVTKLGGVGSDPASAASRLS